MKYAFFQGCNIPVRIEQYARATQAVLQIFDIELVEEREFNCCGYPVRNVDEKSYILPSARNLAIAEKRGMDIAVICNCCYASLMKAKNVLEADNQLREELNLILAKENLRFTGGVEVKHFLTILFNDVGAENLTKKLVYKTRDINIAVIHGCHILRPREITRFDNSFVPQITDTLLRLTGATNLDWQGKLECCGAALAGINDDLCQNLLQEKIDGAQKAGADFIMPVCAYCHLQFDTSQFHLAGESREILPVLLYPQLLGLCLGLEEKQLGISCNKTIADDLLQRLRGSLGPPEEEKKKKGRKKKQAASQSAA